MLRNAILSLLLIPAPATAASAGMPQRHPYRVLLKFNPGQAVYRLARAEAARTATVARTARLAPALTQLLADYRLRVLRPLRPAEAAADPVGISRIFAAELDSSADFAATLAALRRAPEIEYAEPDYVGFAGNGAVDGPAVPDRAAPEAPAIVPDDPLYTSQWGLKNEGQAMGGTPGVPGADINIEPAWDLTTGSSTVLLAVLDTGIPATSNEFGDRLLPGYDFANDDTEPIDDFGHGSNVTSVAAATGNNSNLMAGVDWRCRILPFKILNENNWGYYSWWSAALVAAADSGAQVINMSEGGSSPSQVLLDAVNYAISKGAIVVACMMNDNSEITYYPAAYSQVIAVGAVNNVDERAVPFCYDAQSGSNYGNHIDFVAPGELILGLRHNNAQGTSYWCGTSQATPLVSGTISLLLALQPDLGFDEVYALLKAGAHDLIGPPAEDKPGWDKYFGWGRIDAGATLAAVTTAVHDRPAALPGRFTLAQNYPNPFNPATAISFTLPVEGQVHLEVFNADGRLVRSLLHAALPAGEHKYIWRAQVASGLYFYRLRFQPSGTAASSQVLARKMLLLR